MKQKIWTQRYNVNTFLVNPQKKLGLYGLLNLLQDTAWIHATHLGHGYEAMLKEGTAWVLTRQKLVMKKWPHWGDDIELRTWIRPFNGIIAIRDFEIYLGTEKIGECTTQWLILDLKTRKPADKARSISNEEMLENAPTIVDTAKIILKDGLINLTDFKVRNSDLDLNGHVNNTKYAQWILDSISEEKHQEFDLNEYEVNFIAETKAGDTISIFMAETGPDTFQFQGARSGDGKIMFAATMKVSAKQFLLENNHY